MSDFNYQEYLKNNPLLQKEVEENKLITESQEVTENEEVSEGFFDFLKKKEKEAPVVKDAPKLVGVDFDGNYIYSDDPEIGKKTYAPVYEEEVTEEEIQEEVPSSKIKVSELKAKIKEDIISLLNEDEDEEIEAAEDEIEMDDAEVDVEADVEEPAPTAPAGLSSDEQSIQDSLKVAYDKAVAIGDEKLADQIGNSITFFTRSHVVER